MGQRLVIDIYKNEMDGEPFCKIYMHWSAYIISAYMEILRVYDAIKYAKTDKDIITGLGSVGIYPFSEEFTLINNRYGITTDKKLLIGTMG